MTPRRTALAAISGFVLSALPTLAFAHTGVGSASGFAHGFGHPVSGLDHVLAMVAVGLFAWQLGGRALWAVPAAFVSLMAAGGALGLAGADLPFVELGIALSVIVLGAAVALNVRLPVALAAALVGFFAVFHGFAHGAEMPEDAGGLAYALGFMLATALLHAAGIAIGAGLGSLSGRMTFLLRAAGGGVSALGLGILAGVV